MTTLIELSNGTGIIVEESIPYLISKLATQDTVAIQVTVKDVKHMIMTKHIVEFYEYEYVPIEWQVAPWVSSIRRLRSIMSLQMT